MTTKLPWIPFGTWYMAAVVCALGCEPDQFVSMGSDGQNWDRGGSASITRADAGSAGSPEAEPPAGIQPAESPVGPVTNPPATCAEHACAASACGKFSSPAAPSGVSAGGVIGTPARASETPGAGGTVGGSAAAGTTGETVSMPLKL